MNVNIEQLNTLMTRVSTEQTRINELKDAFQQYLMLDGAIAELRNMKMRNHAYVSVISDLGGSAVNVRVDEESWPMLQGAMITALTLRREKLKVMLDTLDENGLELINGEGE